MHRALEALGIALANVAAYEAYLVEDDFDEPDYYRAEIWLFGACDTTACWADTFTDTVTVYAIKHRAYQ